MTFILLCLGAALMNLPFGFYRAGVPRFSGKWFAAVHFPVPLVVLMRLESGEGWNIVPVLIACAVFGQMLGGILRPGVNTANQTPKQVPVEKDEY